LWYSNLGNSTATRYNTTPQRNQKVKERNKNTLQDVIMTKITMKEWRIYEVNRPLDNNDQPVMLGLPPIITEHFLVGITDYDAIVKSAPVRHVDYSDQQRILEDSHGRKYNITNEKDINRYSYAPELILKQYPDADDITKEFI
jgi:hypothetical protein